MNLISRGRHWSSERLVGCLMAITEYVTQLRSNQAAFQFQPSWTLTVAPKSPTFKNRGPDYSHNVQGHSGHFLHVLFHPPFLSLVLDERYPSRTLGAFIHMLCPGLRVPWGFIHAYFMKHFMPPLGAVLFAPQSLRPSLDLPALKLFKFVLSPPLSDLPPIPTELISWVYITRNITCNALKNPSCLSCCNIVIYKKDVLVI